MILKYGKKLTSEQMLREVTRALTGKDTPQSIAHLIEEIDPSMLLQSYGKQTRRLEQWLVDNVEGMCVSNESSGRATKIKDRPTNKPSAAFYRSSEWRRVRYLALTKSKVCMCCGNTGVLHVDHKIPRSVRPDLALTLSNLQVLCEDCNLGKGNWDSTDWEMNHSA